MKTTTEARLPSKGLEKGCSGLKWVCERATIFFQWKVYERGTFSVKNGI